MRSVRVQFEVKLLLFFCAVLLIVVFFGPGHLSFAEAKAKADAQRTALNPRQLKKLEGTQASFNQAAFPVCQEATDTTAAAFLIVIEIGVDGQVARSWRQGDSAFVVCLQRFITEHFFYISLERPFFMLFEHAAAGQAAA